MLNLKDKIIGNSIFYFSVTFGKFVDSYLLLNGGQPTMSNEQLNKKWGRPALTGCVKSYASMQAREGRALKTALEPISGENTYAMAA